VFVDVLGAGKAFTLIFAAIAGGIAVSSLLNARIVDRLGMRLVSHVSLMGYIAFAVVHALVALSGHETLWTFSLLQAGMMFCFWPGDVELRLDRHGATGPPGRHGGLGPGLHHHHRRALFGFYIGQLFDGTTVPLTLGFAGFGVAGLVAVLITEKGRMFHAGSGARRPRGRVPLGLQRLEALDGVVATSPVSRRRRRSPFSPHPHRGWRDANTHRDGGGVMARTPTGSI